MNNLFTFMGGRFKFFAQGSDLESSAGNGTKTPSDIKPPLHVVFSALHQGPKISAFLIFT